MEPSLPGNQPPGKWNRLNKSIRIQIFSFFKIVRIYPGCHNVASPLLEGECIAVHPFIEDLAVFFARSQFKIKWFVEDLKSPQLSMQETMRGLPLDDDFTISYTSLLDEKRQHILPDFHLRATSSSS
ncbi:hypothetical protein SADUNF_Sadunf07G0013100 [Salix dunnii]|uniref:Uncharacterized protein n=1 Tax=Salix dunnii TaxID=1413687 RepID=A0A835JZE8_9ROSI|nr:hypothetical protein SADUNF_Sadunf07G0013100 [Salix dunnii]